jgi:Protein of unknown function (DUF2752)
MRLVSRPLAPGEFDHELVWLAVSVVAILAGSAWLGLGLGFPRCPLLTMTGYPCLTCGATRCAIAVGHGHLFQAWFWNPLALVGIFGVMLFDLYAAIVLMAGLPRLRLIDWTRREKSAVRIAAVALVGVNWIYLLAHRSQF